MAGKNLTDVGAITVEDNEKMVTQALKVFQAPAINLADQKQVEQRITEYLQECINLGLRPGNMGMYSSLGLTRQDVHDAINGKSHRLSPAVIDTIKKGMLAMTTYREQLGSKGKINPITLIFWQKNFDGLSDQHNISITSGRKETGMTPDEIARAIEKDIPIDLPEAAVMDFDK